MISFRAPRAEYQTAGVPMAGRDLPNAAEGTVGHGAPAPGLGRRLLVVEDDPAVAEVAVAVIETMGHEVMLRQDAPSALALLRQTPGIDMVFSDIVMPGGMSGIDLAEAMAAEFPLVPVLLATGFSRAALGPIPLRFPVLAKPYSVQDLMGRITRMLPARA